MSRKFFIWREYLYSSKVNGEKAPTGAVTQPNQSLNGGKEVYDECLIID
jgi:hypothetical protein